MNYLLQKSQAMKKNLKLAAFVLMLVLGSSMNSNTSAQYNTRDDISYQTFYDELSPYGRWIDYPGYGYVWIPDAGPGFQPYRTNGHWVWTDDYEWMWVSDYDWGWAPFHYGRWFEDPYYGWVWVPDYQWSPAWVAWRQGSDYYGWAPLRPGINISINFNIGGYDPPYGYWSFVPRRYITSPRIYDYCYDRGRNNIYINQTVIINNYNYRGNIFRTGPGRRDVERYTGRITPVRLRDSYSPGRASLRNNQVSLYRPNVNRENNRQYAPRQFDRYNRNNNDSRIGRSNDNGFRNNNINGVARNENTANRNNNLPQREMERQDNRGRQTQNNSIPDPQRINRNSMDRQPQGRSNEGPVRQQPQQIEQRRQNQPRQTETGNNNPRMRQQPSQQMEQRRQNQPRQTETGNNNPRMRQQPSQQMEQRRQNQPRQTETGNNNPRMRQQPSQQMQQRRQEQPRQMDKQPGNGQPEKNNRGKRKF